jgi:hypothetical protein
LVIDRMPAAQSALRIRSTAYDSCAAAHFPRHLFRTSPIVSSCRCEHTTRASRRSAVATGVCHAQTSRWFESPKGYYLLSIRVASGFGEQVASERGSDDSCARELLCLLFRRLFCTSTSDFAGCVLRCRVLCPCSTSINRPAYRCTPRL